MKKSIIKKNYASNVNSHNSPNNSITMSHIPETKGNEISGKEKNKENANANHQKTKKTLLRELRAQNERTYSISRKFL
jgi:hypothetical protein